MKLLKIVLALSLLLSPILAQELTSEEIIELANKIKEFQSREILYKSEVNNLKLQNGLLHRQALLDSNLLVQKNYYIEIVENNSKLLQKQAKLTQPKWYEQNGIYFLGGIATMILGVWSVNKILGDRIDVNLISAEK